MEDRFTDDGTHVYSFLDETLVACPTCGSCAIGRRTDPTSQDWFAPRRVSCTACGFTRDWAERQISRAWGHPAVDDYFHLPLWLQAPCCGEVLWAYNHRHPQFIEDFVRATLRERRRDSDHGWTNASLASRLPAWIKEAKNREVVLKTIDAIRRRGHGV